jgi:predicted metalloprotease
MEWDESEANKGDVIDQRGAGGGGSGPDLGSVLGGVLGGGAGGGSMGSGRGFPMGGKGKGGLLGLLLMAAAAFILPKILGGSGIDISTAGLNSSGSSTDASIPASEDPNAEVATFSNVIITDTNNVWQQQFQDAGKSYKRTKLVLFSGSVQSGCGPASAAMGPFYCPTDELVYIDLAFFDELRTRFGAAGDFAQAYVIAHEVGHHVQNSLGISDQVHQQEQENPDLAQGADSLSVRLELQADCLAGVWAHSRYERGQADPAKRLDDGDIEEALNAASGVGDDAIQKSATGRVNPEGFTHGTSKQRKKWFTAGYDSGNSESCDTFSADTL